MTARWDVTLGLWRLALLAYCAVCWLEVARLVEWASR